MSETSYEGCNSDIRRALLRGDHIKCTHRGSLCLCVGYIRNASHPYLGYCNSMVGSYDNLVPIPKTETRVKKASVIVKWLEENGYAPNKYGNWVKMGCVSFLTGMFQYCTYKPEVHHFRKAWLEEVEI